jgi:hypothetical protein
MKTIEIQPSRKAGRKSIWNVCYCGQSWRRRLREGTECMYFPGGPYLLYGGYILSQKECRKPGILALLSFQI